MTEDEIDRKFERWQVKTLGQAIAVAASWIYEVAGCTRLEAWQYLIHCLQEQVENDHDPEAN